MAYTRSVNTSLFLALFLISLFPFIRSLSTVAISETGNQTLVCAIVNSVVNCTSFPRRIQIQLNPILPTVSGIVGGDGFLCALTSSHSASNSVMVCWRFADVGNTMSYRRVYSGPLLTDLASGNAHVCGLVNSSNSLECWQWRGVSDGVADVISSNLAVGENFVCGLSGLGRVRCLGSDRNVTDDIPERNFTQIKAGFHHVCGISYNGSLECWGDMAGEWPEGEFTSLALGENRGCAIRPNEKVVCWGENGFALPESLRDQSFLSIEAKRRIFCGVEISNYRLLCWGNEDFDSNTLVFDDVVPGSCRSIAECGCGSLPNYGEYCAQGLVICNPCDGRDRASSQPLPPPPPFPLPSPPPSVPPAPPSSRVNKWSGKLVAFVVVGSVGTFSSLLVVCIFLFSRYIKIRGSRIHDSGRLEEGSPSHPSGGTPPSQPTPTRVLEKKISHLISMGNGGLEEFSLQVLLNATDNFSEELKIGNGSFGSVYHGTLDDGRQVAIKRAETSASSSYAGGTKRGQEDKDNAFLNELEFLSRLNHKNLVRLLGYCEDSNERVLVYEYMNNGTLFDHLHKLESSALMSWPKRIKVALDAARGIEYLHEYAVPCIIHRDIKSSNILLDATWMAKVSDFGLSLMGPQNDEPHLSLRAAGTMGYMDPEYYRLQLLTTKSDVYSFGVMLMELLSGHKAIHKNENGVPRNVVDYVVPYIIQDEIHRVLDERVPPPTPFEIEAVAYVGYLAVDCVMLEGQDRPAMSEVVDSLERALEACSATSVLSRSTTRSST